MSKSPLVNMIKGVAVGMAAGAVVGYAGKSAADEQRLAKTLPSCPRYDAPLAKRFEKCILSKGAPGAASRCQNHFMTAGQFMSRSDNSWPRPFHAAKRQFIPVPTQDNPFNVFNDGNHLVGNE